MEIDILEEREMDEFVRELAKCSSADDRDNLLRSSYPEVYVQFLLTRDRSDELDKLFEENKMFSRHLMLEVYPRLRQLKR